MHRGLRAVLPPRLQRPPDRRVAAGARRRRGQARAGRARRRRGLRPRRVHDPDGAGVPATRRSSARTITTARSRPRAARADEAGVADRVRFETAPAAAYEGTGYDLVTMFDCLHDMGDPVGAARHVLQHARARRHLDDRRAAGRRPGRGQPQPRRAGVLRVLHAAVHARVAVAGRRARARRAGRRGADRRRRRRRAASPGSAGSRRPRSTPCSRLARERGRSPGRGARGSW